MYIVYFICVHEEELAAGKVSSKHSGRQDVQGKKCAPKMTKDPEIWRRYGEFLRKLDHSHDQISHPKTRLVYSQFRLQYIFFQKQDGNHEPECSHV